MRKMPLLDQSYWTTLTGKVLLGYATSSVVLLGYHWFAHVYMSPKMSLSSRRIVVMSDSRFVKKKREFGKGWRVESARVIATEAVTKDQLLEP